MFIKKSACRDAQPCVSTAGDQAEIGGKWNGLKTLPEEVCLRKFNVILAKAIISDFKMHRFTLLFYRRIPGFKCRVSGVRAFCANLKPETRAWNTQCEITDYDRAKYIEPPHLPTAFITKSASRIDTHHLWKISLPAR